MKSLAIKASVNPTFRARVAFVTRNCGNSFDCITEAIERFVRREVRYLEEPDEIVMDPETMLEMLDRRQPTFGDCDDHATLVAAMLRASGIPAAFVVIGLTAGNPEHVLVSAYKGDKQAYLDTTQADAYDIRRFKFQRAYPLD